MPRLYKHDPALHARALRALESLRVNTGSGVLERAYASRAPLLLGLHDGVWRKATIRAVDHKTFETDEGKYTKIEVLFAAEIDAAKKLKRVVKRDESVARLGRRVSPEPRERLGVSKMLLQRLVDEPGIARYTLADGTVIPCRTRSFGFYEVNAEVKGGGAVTLFRHGLHRIALGDEILADFALGTHVQGR